MPRLSLSAAYTVAGLTLFPHSSAPDPSPLRGFTPESSRIERDWETKFKAIPDPARMRSAMQLLAARPHHVGSPYGKQNAEWIRAQFQSYGWDV
jgi:N-acetylated-alpha-linked acidic dipeptidase